MRSVDQRFLPYIHRNQFFHGKIANRVLVVLLFPFAWVYSVWMRIMSRFAEKKNFQTQLAIVAIIKNEGPYLDEWICYHRLIGVEKFLLYDNESTDDTCSVLKPYIEKGIVDYRLIKGRQRQLVAYHDAVLRYYKKVKYLAVIDADEFLYSDRDDEILPYLDAAFSKNIGGLCFNWLMFGSSGYLEKPEGLVTENYLHCAEENFLPPNVHIKSIVNPRRVRCFVNPHSALYLKNYHAYDTEGNRVDGAFTKEPHHNGWRIDHYFTKSKAEFTKKRLRGNADVLIFRSEEEFDLNDRNEVFDDGMLRFSQRIKNEITKMRSE